MIRKLTQLKKRIIALAATLLLFGMSACTSAAEPPDISQKESQKGNFAIDFSFTHAFDPALPPLTFRVLGKAHPFQRVHVQNIEIYGANGALLQNLTANVWLHNTGAQNLYGLEFGDYNTDGAMDVAIRRFSGDSKYGRSHFYWLWNAETQQYEYAWKLSEEVTDENLIDFTVEQQIHSDMPPFTIRLLGRRVDGWSRETADMVNNLDANIHFIQVMDGNGAFLQEFDKLDALPPQYADDYGLHFADYNFDGFLDMALFMSEGGSMRNQPHQYWLWDNTAQQFVYNEQLTALSDFSTVSVNAENARIETFTRTGLGMYFTAHYEYADGEFVLVYSFEQLILPSPEQAHKYIRHEIICELVDGELVTTENYYDNWE